MKTNSIYCAILAISIFILSNNTRAANHTIVSDMSSVIGQSKLSDTKKEMLVSTLKDVLLSAPELDADKKKTAKSNLNMYMSEKIMRQIECTDEQFNVVAKTFRYDLENYVSLPAINDAQRTGSLKQIDQLKSITKQFIEESYPNKTSAAKNEIYSFIDNRLTQDSGRIGNYLYPYFLYPKGDEAPRNELVAALRKSITSKDNIALPTIVESSRMYGAIQSVLIKMFTIEKARKDNKFKAVPKELSNEQRTLYQELLKTSKAKQEQLKKQFKYHEVVMGISAGASFNNIVNGMNVDKVMPVDAETTNNLINKADPTINKKLANAAPTPKIMAAESKDSDIKSKSSRNLLIAPGIFIIAVAVTVIFIRRRNSRIN
ncbi:hypothetical protein LLG95_16775 [bacterium]|nr:hypothetical protein [bacterium]